MDLGIAGKAALVCASTSGLGAATAQALAAEGSRVVFAGRRAELARELAGRYPGCVGLAADLSTVAGAQALHDAAVRAVGPLDIVVLNSPPPPPGTAADLDPPALTESLASLLLAPPALVGAALPHLRQQRWGRILAIGSSSVQAPIPGLAASNTGRAALAGYLKTLAGEVAADGITVNLLLPGRIATDRMRSLDETVARASGRPTAEVAAESLRLIPAGRLGDPAQFGAVAAFLCGEPAAYVTGTAVRCDGGLIPTL
jgi:3-oxoacyl-[acyl-carrier protein] reductase